MYADLRELNAVDTDRSPLEVVRNSKRLARLGKSAVQDTAQSDLQRFHVHSGDMAVMAVLVPPLVVTEAEVAA